MTTALVLAAGCASHPAAGFDHFAWRLDLPVDTTAAIVAGAVQRATGCEQPDAPEGAIADPLPGGGFRIAYQRVGDRWQAHGSVRLRVRDRGMQTVVMPCGPHRGDDTSASIDLRVQSDGSATTVSGRLPTALRRPLNDALRLALDPDAALPGLDEPNLARHVAACLRRRAEAAETSGDADTAASLRRRAAALGDTAPELLLQVGDHAAASGDEARARVSYWHALARCREPSARAVLAARLAALDEPSHADASRRAAMARLAVGDANRAAGLLHCAVRDRRDPTRDYALLGELHRRSDDSTGARACDLLAREHTVVGTGTAPALVATPVQRAEATAPALASPIR